MKDKIKRLLALFLALVMSFSLFACGDDGYYDEDDDDDDDEREEQRDDENKDDEGKDDDKDNDNGNSNDNGNGNEADVDRKIKISIGLGSNAKITDFEDNALTRWLEEQCNVKIEIVEYVGGTDVAEQISATIAQRQDLPDILWGVDIDTKKIHQYGQEGYFADLLPYYEDSEGASKVFWNRIIESLSEYEQEYILSTIRDPETGGIYSVPTVETSLVSGLDSMAWINQQWLDKLNLQAPTNTEELYAVLKAFKENDCNGNGDKSDEIPLMGSQYASDPAKVINWLINMHMYYNEHHLWQDYDGDGQIEAAYTQDAYREALSFVNKLYEEKLLTSMVYTAPSSDMKSITTPNNGTALCGIFLGDLTKDTSFSNEVLYEYVALKGWGCATESDISVKTDCFITETAVNKGIADKCFELLMTMWSWDGSMRIRYGEYGVNWTDADPGAVSEYGLPATYKLLNDPFTQQNDVMWGSYGGSLFHYAEGETAQMAEELDDWQKAKSKMHAQARAYFDWAEENINPQFITDPFLEQLNLTQSDDEWISMQRANVNNVVNTYVKNFVTGAKKMDPENPAHWQQFLDELAFEGYENLRSMYQKYYEMNR